MWDKCRPFIFRPEYITPCLNYYDDNTIVNATGAILSYGLRRSHCDYTDLGLTPDEIVRLEGTFKQIDEDREWTKQLMEMCGHTQADIDDAWQWRKPLIGLNDHW